MELSIKYGRGTQSVHIEDSRLVAQLGGGAYRAIEDVQAAVNQAIAYPVGPYLEEVVSHGDRVLIMTVDHTRPNPSQMLWPLAERVRALGGKPEVMIGLGNHRAMAPEELQRFIGTSEVYQNDSSGSDQWRLGHTTHGSPIEVSPVLEQFDKRMVVGFIEPHYIAGFSGGRKMILPGVASRQSITHNHFLTALHGPQLGRLVGNPVHEDMQQAAMAVGVDWICDAVVNPDDTFHTIWCGDLRAAHQAGVRAAETLYSQTVPRKADIVICSAGGWPYDVDMVQAKKTLAPAMECVKPSGVVILLGECERGWGASEPDWDLLRAETVLPTRRTLNSRLQQGRCERQWAPSSPGLLFSRVVHDVPARLILVCSLNDRLTDTYLETADTVAQAVELAQETVGKQASVTVIHDGRRALCRVAQDSAGRGAP